MNVGDYLFVLLLVKSLHEDLGEGPGSWTHVRATSHTRLRARDHYILSTLIWWKRRSRSKIASHYA